MRISLKMLRLDSQVNIQRCLLALFRLGLLGILFGAKKDKRGKSSGMLTAAAFEALAGGDVATLTREIDVRVAIKTKNPSEVMFIAWTGLDRERERGGERGEGRVKGELFSECRIFVRSQTEKRAAVDRCRIYADVANRWLSEYSIESVVCLHVNMLRP